MGKFGWIDEPLMRRVAIHVEDDGSYTEVFEESSRMSEETLAKLGTITPLGGMEVVNTRTGETFKVEAKPAGPMRTWHFGSLD